MRRTIPLDYAPPPDLLKGRNILISGAGDGIGRALAEACAAHGATVVLLGRTLAKLEAVYDAIVAAGAPEPVVHPLDLATAGMADYEALASALEAEFGALHGLVHNAALLGDRRPLEQYPLDLWQRVLKVNLEAGFALSRALLPALRAAEEASVLFTSSSVGRRGRAYWGAYAVSKGGVEILAQVLAEELENTTAIRVNCLNPGATNTAMRRQAYPAENPARNPEPASILGPWLYLLGPASRGLSGCSIDAQSGEILPY